MKSAKRTRLALFCKHSRKSSDSPLYPSALERHAKREIPDWDEPTLQRLSVPTANCLRCQSERNRRKTFGEILDELLSLKQQSVPKATVDQKATVETFLSQSQVVSMTAARLAAAARPSPDESAQALFAGWNPFTPIGAPAPAAPPPVAAQTCPSCFHKGDDGITCNSVFLYRERPFRKQFVGPR